ncbi:hypothetical protein ACO0SA_004491 [Hanseniaspora valbyensis]
MTDLRNKGNIMQSNSNKKRGSSSSSSGFVRISTNESHFSPYYPSYQQIPMSSSNTDEFNFTQVPAGFIIMPQTTPTSREFNPYSAQVVHLSDNDDDDDIGEENEDNDNISPYQSPGTINITPINGKFSNQERTFSSSSDRSFNNTNNQFVESNQIRGEEYHYGNFRQQQQQGGNFALSAPMGMLPLNSWGQPIPIPVPMPMNMNMVHIPVGSSGLQMPPFISNNNERQQPYHYNNNNNNNNNGNKKRYQMNNQFNKNKNEYSRKNSHTNNPSHLVDDSFSNKKISDFKGQLYELSIQQQGSRFIQKELTQDDLPLVLEEILPHVVELSQHSFGNYLVQKLIELSDQSQKLNILNILRTSNVGIIGIASDPHGTRTLQRIVSELMEFDEGVQALIDTFKGNIISLSENLNGNHVIQELLASLNPKDIQFIFDEVYENIEEVSVERHGCCVLQRCIDNGDSNQISKLCELILKHTLELSKDPFGNYVVQYILQMEKDKYFQLKNTSEKDLQEKVDEIFVFSKKICSDLSPFLKDLCFHKFGSNVIENIMKIPCGLSTGLFDKMIQLFKDGGSEIMNKFLTDPFANYVLQTSLLSSQKQSNKNNHFASFVSLLKPVIENEIHVLEESRNKNQYSQQKDHENYMKMLQLQRVLTICNSDYVKNRENTNYNSWGPNFNTKNHESFGIDKKKSKLNNNNSNKKNNNNNNNNNSGSFKKLSNNYNGLNYTSANNDIQSQYNRHPNDDQGNNNNSNNNAFKRDYVGVVPLGKNI